MIEILNINQVHEYPKEISEKGEDENCAPEPFLTPVFIRKKFNQDQRVEEEASSDQVKPHSNEEFTNTCFRKIIAVKTEEDDPA